jgi:hypothetical protein
MSDYPPGGRQAYDDGYGHANGQQDHQYQDDDRYYDSNGYDNGQQGQHGQQGGDGYYDEAYVHTGCLEYLALIPETAAITTPIRATPITTTEDTTTTRINTKMTTTVMVAKTTKTSPRAMALGLNAMGLRRIQRRSAISP